MGEGGRGRVRAVRRLRHQRVQPLGGDRDRQASEGGWPRGPAAPSTDDLTMPYAAYGPGICSQAARMSFVAPMPATKVSDDRPQLPDRCCLPVRSSRPSLSGEAGPPRSVTTTVRRAGHGQTVLATGRWRRNRPPASSAGPPDRPSGDLGSAAGRSDHPDEPRDRARAAGGRCLSRAGTLGLPLEGDDDGSRPRTQARSARRPPEEAAANRERVFNPRSRVSLRRRTRHGRAAYKVALNRYEITDDAPPARRPWPSAAPSSAGPETIPTPRAPDGVVQTIMNRRICGHRCAGRASGEDQWPGCG
jgi:hypothetical protein